MRLAPVLLWVLLFAGSAQPGLPADGPDAPDKAEGLSGQLLVAAPDLGDPNFDHTVVLMLQHDGNGALGLVVNRPYGTAPTGELLKRLGVQVPRTVAGGTLLYYGGPVQPEVGMILHSPDYSRPDTKRITADIAVTTDPAVLADKAQGRGPRRSIPVLGYAGWGPGQLESELAQGAWFTLPADPELVFAPDPGKIWDAAFARRGIEL
jgi:putative transcriptional regulator